MSNNLPEQLEQLATLEKAIPTRQQFPNMTDKQFAHMLEFRREQALAAALPVAKETEAERNAK